MDISNPSVFASASEYVYQNHLSKPYRDAPGEVYPKGSGTSQKVYRPNHGLAHSIRKAIHLNSIFPMYTACGLPTIFPVNGVTWQLERDLIYLKLALLFSVTGRESEISHVDNEKLYDSYRKASADNFERWVNANLAYPNRDKIKEFKAVIYTPHYSSSKPYYDAMRSLFRICHQVDLLRCYNHDEWKNVLSVIAKSLRISSNHQFISQIEGYSLRCLRATGDQVFSMGERYNFERFCSSSTSVSTCLHYLAHVTLPKIQPPPSTPMHPSTQKGVEYYEAKQYSKAISCFNDAIKSQDARAYYMLGSMSYNGEGVPKDLEKAEQYFRVSAAKGYEKANRALNIVKQEALKEITKQMQQVNVGSSGDALYEQGVTLYNSGRHIDAVKCFDQARLAGNARANFMIAYCYFKGHGVHQNYEKTIQFLRVALQHKLPEAYGLMGVCLINGNGCQTNRKLAIEHWTVGAHKGDQRSKEMLKIYQ